MNRECVHDPELEALTLPVLSAYSNIQILLLGDEKSVCTDLLSAAYIAAYVVFDHIITK